MALEAAPTERSRRCDHAVFEARGAAEYLSVFQRFGLSAEAVTGVDPAPWKAAYLPLHRRLPGFCGQACLAGITAVSWPIDAVIGRRWVSRSWHKVFVLGRVRGRTT